MSLPSPLSKPSKLMMIAMATSCGNEFHCLIICCMKTPLFLAHPMPPANHWKAPPSSIVREGERHTCPLTLRTSHITLQASVRTPILHFLFQAKEPQSCCKKEAPPSDHVGGTFLGCLFKLYNILWSSNRTRTQE